MAAFSNPLAYERWMGRWSRLLAPAFVKFARIQPGAELLDVGSGTGILAAALLEHGDVTVVGIDPAEAYVALSRRSITTDRVRFEVGDAQSIPFDEDAFDATVSLLILQELPDAPQALREMRRVTRSGGPVAACQWDFAHGLPMLSLFWNVVLEVAPSERARSTANVTMKVGYPDDLAIRQLWEDTGLREVVTERLTIDMAFESFDDYWDPFLSNVTQTSSYLGTLAPEHTAAVRTLLRQKTVGDGPDRSFVLEASAWAVRGTVP